MLIECPFCKARANIADSKEGAKVRCGDCGRVYGARPVGAKRSSASTNITPFIIGGVVILTGAILFIITNGDDPKPRTNVFEPPKEQVAKPQELTGFESPVVQTAVKMHNDAKAGNRTPLTVRLAGDALWAAERGEDDPTWDELDTIERNAKLEAWVDLLVDADNPNGPANWEPYNGELEQTELGVITVSLQCTPSDGGIEAKRFEWLLREDGERFKVVGWSRFEKPKVADKGSPGSLKGVEKVTLTDGSRVVEREPEALPHLETTPPDLRAEIDDLYTKIIDLSLTKEMSAAKNRLEAIGKPAIPRLLTGLYEIELTDIDTARQVQNIIYVLRRITDEYFGYEPLTMVGSGMGTTEERRASAIKQWFAWWYRNGEKFTEAAREDMLGEFAELTEADKKWLKRNQDK